MKQKILFGVALIAFAAMAQVQGALNLYVKTVPALPGEVTTPVAWVDAWQVLSLSMGVSNPATVNATGVHTGNPSFSDLNLQKLLDRASVASLLKTAQGGHLDSVTLSCVNAGTNALVYEIKLEEVVISSIQHSGSSGGDDRPTESISFTYAKITWKYYPPTGSPITAFWDQRTNSGG